MKSPSKNESECPRIHEPNNENCKCAACCHTETVPMSFGSHSKMAKSNGKISTPGGSSDPM